MQADEDVSKFPGQGSRCPFAGTDSVTQSPNGTWHIRDFEAARTVLRDKGTVQTGFDADAVRSSMSALNIRVSVLYQDGAPHLEQRRWVARSFTPSMVGSRYHPTMERIADDLLASLRRCGQADLSELALKMAVGVAADVVGLTNSHRRAHLTRRVENLFAVEAVTFSLRPAILWKMMKVIPVVASFYLMDVLPAIRARRHARSEDVISTLMDQKAKSFDILGECMTYGAAGMVTTREFICMATWHMLRNDEVRRDYLAAAQPERLDMLREILRVQPVIGHLQRRTTADIPVNDQVIPAGAAVQIHVHDINLREHLGRPEPGHTPCAARPTGPMHTEVMAFGDGRHRCPGEHVAIMETDVLLDRLLRLPGLRIVREPRLTLNERLSTYELRDFHIAIDQ